MHLDGLFERGNANLGVSNLDLSKVKYHVVVSHEGPQDHLEPGMINQYVPMLKTTGGVPKETLPNQVWPWTSVSGLDATVRLKS
jgi:hypothetical protein